MVLQSNAARDMNPIESTSLTTWVEWKQLKLACLNPVNLGTCEWSSLEQLLLSSDLRNQCYLIAQVTQDWYDQKLKSNICLAELMDEFLPICQGVEDTVDALKDSNEVSEAWYLQAVLLYKLAKIEQDILGRSTKALEKFSAYQLAVENYGRSVNYNSECFFHDILEKGIYDHFRAFVNLKHYQDAAELILYREFTFPHIWRDCINLLKHAAVVEMEKAKEHYQNAEYQKSIQKLEAGLRAYDALDLLQCDFRDDVSTAYINRVMCYLQLQEYEHAMEDIKLVNILDASNQHAWSLHVLLLCLNKEFQNASKTCEMAQTHALDNSCSAWEILHSFENSPMQTSALNATTTNDREGTENNEILKTQSSPALENRSKTIECFENAHDNNELTFSEKPTIKNKDCTDSPACNGVENGNNSSHVAVNTKLHTFLDAMPSPNSGPSMSTRKYDVASMATNKLQAFLNTHV